MLLERNLSSQDLWLNIYKPDGYSSAKIVSIVKKITSAKKVGHAGTLDPFARGVLPIAINKATKTCSYIADTIKKYYFEISWGEFRDSDDITGNIIESSNKRPNFIDIVDILPMFIGNIEQVPSIFSAIKVNGQRSYKLAREGQEVVLKSRRVKIFSIKLIYSDANKAAFEIVCSKGTYVRSLARDISKKLNVCGYVSKLERLQVGLFLAKDTISLDKLKNIFKFSVSDDLLLRLRDVLHFITEIKLNSFDVEKIRNGQFIDYSCNFLQEQSVVKVIFNDILIALAKFENNSLKPINVF